MVIWDLTGNVGIGTTAPGSVKLNVTGTIDAWQVMVNGTAVSTGSGDLSDYAVTNESESFTENVTFDKDVIVSGTLYGGSPLRVAGGLNVIDGSVDFPSNTIASADVNFNYAASSSKGGAATTGDTATAFFSTGTIEDARLSFTLQDAVTDGGCTDCITDAMVSNTLTASYATSAGSATTATTATTANAGDSATAFFSTGTIATAQTAAKCTSATCSDAVDACSDCDATFVNEAQANSISSGMVAFNYAASSSEGGSATSGDSATAFFSSGTIEDARLSFTLADAVSDGGCTNCITDAMVSNTLTASSATTASGLSCSNCVALGSETTGSYAAGTAEAGAATSGDSATAFFSSGTIEDARLSFTLQDAVTDGGCTNCITDAMVSNTLTASTLISPSAGDVIIARNDYPAQTEATTYAFQKYMTVIRSGTFRITFDMKQESAIQTAYGRIYKNGVAFGTVRSTHSETYVTFSEDLTFSTGDHIELYTYTTNSVKDTWCRNFRAKASTDCLGVVGNR